MGKHEGVGSHFSDLLQNLHTSLLDQIKSVMANLQVGVVTYRQHTGGYGYLGKLQMGVVT